MHQELANTRGLLNSESTLVFTVTPSNEDSLPDIPLDPSLREHLKRLLADVNLYHGSLSVMDNNEWIVVRNAALDGTVDAFWYYYRKMLDTCTILFHSHRPDVLLKQWFPRAGADVSVAVRPRPAVVKKNGMIVRRRRPDSWRSVIATASERPRYAKSPAAHAINPRRK